MTGIAELHAQALDVTGRIVTGIPAGRWHAATPCAGWDVHAQSQDRSMPGNCRSRQTPPPDPVPGDTRPGKNRDGSGVLDAGSPARCARGGGCGVVGGGVVW
ncbi:MAG: hypothetical protein ACXV3F_14405, partial [Frankiaceae bacterium]